MEINIISIDDVGLSNRSANALHRANIHNVEMLLKCTEETLSQVRNLGRKSVEEILDKIKEIQKAEEEGGYGKREKEIKEFSVPENFTEWLKEKENREQFICYLKENNTKIEALELLSAKAFNLLKFSGYDYIHQIIFFSEEKLMDIPRMDSLTAEEVVKRCIWYINDEKNKFFESIVAKQQNTNTREWEIKEMILRKENHDKILEYVKENNLEIEQMGLSNRPKNQLLKNGFYQMSDIIFLSKRDLQLIPAMGTSSVEEILQKIIGYLGKHETRIKAVLSGDEAAFWDDQMICDKILEIFQKIGFEGLGFHSIMEQLKLPEQITENRVKQNIGKLISQNKLEYVDYRCYKIYDKFFEYVNQCEGIDERNKAFIQKRLQGYTLEEIGQEYGVTRERVRQILKRDSEKVRRIYQGIKGTELFDEDYFRYFYENYAFDKQVGSEWFGLTQNIWRYMELMEVKQGNKKLNEALDDVKNLETGLRLKIKNYLNRNKIYIDDRWIEKKRSDIEEYVVRKFCVEDKSFDEFTNLYNEFLKSEEIPFDEDLYYTDAIIRTRKNRLAETRFLLWKQNEQIRYYDIDGQDFSELLETLNLESYENTEISTLKFMEDYPEVMKKYDIRNQYELHNLLRKIVSEDSYHEFHCERTPNIRFGTFDRESAFFELLKDNAPIGYYDFIELIHKEYGYDQGTVMGSYLQNFKNYYHNGQFFIEQKIMSPEKQLILKKELTNDFYYIDEIREIYNKIFVEADKEEVNAYSLRMMGFQVLSRYAVQNYSTLDAYFTEILTRDDVFDLMPYRKRFAYVPAFNQALMELQRAMEIIEFQTNQMIHIRKLEKAGVTKEMLREFCQQVYEYIDEGQYFSAESLRTSGFESELYELGFSDWFYANIIAADERFSSMKMFRNIILYKGQKDISCKSFESELIKKHGRMDVYELMTELTDTYGCKIMDKGELLYKLRGTEIFYDKILDRLYANAEVYYRELEEMEDL